MGQKFIARESVFCVMDSHKYIFSEARNAHAVK